MSAISPTAVGANYADSDLERLKGSEPKTPEEHKLRLRKAAEEFESLFMYQMLKSMRKTIGENSLAKGTPMASGMGKDAFMDMFDVHLARRMVNGDKGSIADILYNRLLKTIEPAADPGEMELGPLRPIDDNAPIRIQRPDLPMEQPGRRPIPLDGPGLEPMPIRDPESRPTPPPSSVRERYGAIIDEAALEHDVDSALITAVIEKESGGNPKAVSRAGAKGLMQLMDSTASDLGVDQVFDERENIMSGTRYLRSMLIRFNGDVRLALAAYNAGPGTVERYGDIPPYKETQNYVKEVLDTAAENGMRIDPAALKLGPTGADN